MAALNLRSICILHHTFSFLSQLQMYFYPLKHFGKHLLTGRNLLLVWRWTNPFLAHLPGSFLKISTMFCCNIQVFHLHWFSRLRRESLPGLLCRNLLIALTFLLFVFFEKRSQLDCKRSYNACKNGILFFRLAEVKHQ